MTVSSSVTSSSLGSSASVQLFCSSSKFALKSVLVKVLDDVSVWEISVENIKDKLEFRSQPKLLSFPVCVSVSVMNKGQCVTKYYRWIQKNGGYIWIQSSATIAINAKNSNEKNVIWVNYVLRSEMNSVFDLHLPDVYLTTNKRTINTD